jgi:hypothetical protein
MAIKDLLLESIDGLTFGLDSSITKLANMKLALQEMKAEVEKLPDDPEPMPEPAPEPEPTPDPDPDPTPSPDPVPDGEPLPRLMHGIPDFRAHPDAVVVTGDMRIEGVTADSTLVIDGGRLIVSGAVTFHTIQVINGGTLVIEDGAELLCDDVPTDPITDPDQWGHGLIFVDSNFVVAGESKTSFENAILHPILAGHSFIFMDEPDDWSVGDAVLVPKTSQTVDDKGFSQWDNAENEINYIAEIQPDGIVLMAPLEFDHPLPPNNELGVMRPVPIYNLTRSCWIGSDLANEGPERRGHIVFSGNCQLDVPGLTVSGMGRTTAAEISDTNRLGRYAWHYHHFTGTASVRNLVVEDGLRGCYVLHNSRNIVTTDSIFFNAQGACIVLEDGRERDNAFIDYHAIGGKGDPARLDHGYAGIGDLRVPDENGVLVKVDNWFDGSGVWVRHINNNIFQNGKIYGCRGWGFNLNDVFNSYHDKASTAGFVDKLPLAEGGCKGIEIAGCAHGFWSSWQYRGARLVTTPQVFEDILVWNTPEALYITHERLMTLRNFVAIADPAVTSKSPVVAWWTTVNLPIALNCGGGQNYMMIEVRFENCFVSGFAVGVIVPMGRENEEPQQSGFHVAGQMANWADVIAGPFSPAYDASGVVHLPIDPALKRVGGLPEEHRETWVAGTE